SSRHCFPCNGAPVMLSQDRGLPGRSCCGRVVGDHHTVSQTDPTAGCRQPRHEVLLAFLADGPACPPVSSRRRARFVRGLEPILQSDTRSPRFSYQRSAREVLPWPPLLPCSYSRG